MIVIELYKYKKHLNDFRLKASFIQSKETIQIIEDIKYLSKAYGYKYIVNTIKYNINKDTELLDSYNIEEV